MTDSVNLKHKKWEELSEDQREMLRDSIKNWRSWGSWFSWGSPVGLGLFLLAIGGFILLLHLAHLIG